MTRYINDTIVALATPPGRGGIGVVRVSGPLVKTIAQAILGKLPKTRTAEYLPFYAEQHLLDEGIAIYYQAPQSFTGEDVLELQGHGGLVVMDSIIHHILTLGARLAIAGEFSQRAFLNNKIDLIQAEAIADLINAGSQQAARLALRSLQGEFSKQIQLLLQQLIHLRIYVEAAIDFPDEEIDFMSDGNIKEDIQGLLEQLIKIQKAAKQGEVLQQGLHLVIVGAPNVGKSSLLNQLCGEDKAIVTDIPGTTRDLLQGHIHLEGLPIHIIDTAGLRTSDDQIEQEGIKRALAEVEKADHVLLLRDSLCDYQQDPVELTYPQLKKCAYTIIYNKIDLIQKSPEIRNESDQTTIYLSAKTGEGLDLLRQHLMHCAGYQIEEGSFSARRRHLNALKKVQTHLQQALSVLIEQRAGELVAEDLKAAQDALSSITGAFTADDLLGEIFGSFCIGK